MGIAAADLDQSKCLRDAASKLVFFIRYEAVAHLESMNVGKRGVFHSPFEIQFQCTESKNEESSKWMCGYRHRSGRVDLTLQYLR